MKGLLDDNHTLYDDGSVVRVYDKHTYPGGQDRQQTLNGPDLKEEVKKRLLANASDENKDLVKKLLDYKDR